MNLKRSLANLGSCRKLIVLLTVVCIVIVLFYSQMSPNFNQKIHSIKNGLKPLEQKHIDAYMKGIIEDESEYNKLKLYFNNNNKRKLLPVYTNKYNHFLLDKDSPQRQFYDHGRIIVTSSPFEKKEPNMRKVGNNVWIETKPNKADPPKKTIDHGKQNNEHERQKVLGNEFKQSTRKPEPVARLATPVKPPAKRKQLIRFKERQILVDQSYTEKPGNKIIPHEVTAKPTAGTTRKWDGILPQCLDFIKEFKMNDVKCLFLSMFDPGNCSLVSDTHKKFMPHVNDTEQDRIIVWGFHELWDACHHPWFTHKTGRFCDGMPPFLQEGTLMQHYAIDPVSQALAIDELGPKCYNSKLGIYFNPNNVHHKGGPRKVINNLLSSLRKIGKVYYTNGHDVDEYDYKVILDPFYRVFFYHLNKSDKPWNYFLGPTVAAFQFDLSRISNASRDYVHIVGASKQALDKTDQYFPGLPMPRENALIIPTGVDTDYFKPNVSYTQRKRKLSLFYFKVSRISFCS